ncbi:hypothetical protein GUITHDRAFT_41323, partial [Guillardia theta CCMP2712]
PFAGILHDLRSRAPFYLSDWVDGLKENITILAPSTYIFFASIIPALTFGEQLDDYTEGALNGVHVILATAVCGAIQSILGGQPLLIVGVAEPIVLVYGYMYKIAKTANIPFVPWASATLFWVAIMLAGLAAINSCSYINHFSRFSGELFGLLIATLFFQEAIKGLYSEFHPLGSVVHSSSSMQTESRIWLMFNGSFSIVLAGGLLFTSLASISMRHTVYFRRVLRHFISDYGTALAVLLWTLVSYIPKGVPDGIPRRLLIPNALDGSPNYTVLSRMQELEGWHWAAALIPAVIIAVLFFFDHNVSSQLAQNVMDLKKPPAYHWDFLLLAIMTLICGLLGIPPVNGVIPQAPMHARANRKWFKEKHVEKGTAGQPGEEKIHLRAEIVENRVSNLIQSILCGICLPLTFIIQKIPRSVLWGFFAFMAIEGLPGNQFFERLLLFLTDRKQVFRLRSGHHPSFLDKVPMKTIQKFTLMQLVFLLICYGITWAGIAGISFPLFIMIIVPARQKLFPKFFRDEDLQHLD